MWITTAAQLAEKLPMTAEELAAVQAVADRYPMCITPYYLGLIDPNDPDDPIRKMAVPAPIEEEEGGSFDTSGEQSNTRVPGLQHKYLQTAMVLTTNRCAMYCRHCFRKRLVGLTDEEIAANFERVTGYIREHEEITNVLLSGGDSFLNSNETIARYLDALTPIGHLNYIRFGTRTPVTWPERIDEALCETLTRYTARKTIFVVTQFNHPREITPESAAAVAALFAGLIDAARDFLADALGGFAGQQGCGAGADVALHLRTPAFPPLLLRSRFVARHDRGHGSLDVVAAAAALDRRQQTVIGDARLCGQRLLGQAVLRAEHDDLHAVFGVRLAVARLRFVLLHNVSSFQQA